MSADIASNVMPELRRDNLKVPSPEPEELRAIEQQLRDQCGEWSDPYYATSRLWYEGIIDPAETRDVVGLYLPLVTSIPDQGPRTPVYRM